MAIRYSQIQDEKNPFFGKADDPRHVISVSWCSDEHSDNDQTWGCSHTVASLINPDYTIESVTVARTGWMEFDCTKYIEVDATPEDLQNLREKDVADNGLRPCKCSHMGVKPGDMLLVAKGRKVPVGTKFVLSEVKDYRDCYGRFLTYYAYGTDGTKVDLKNCEMLKFGNGRLPEIAEGDTVKVGKDIINPTTGEVKYRAGTVVEVAGFERKSWNGKVREYIIGTKGERIFKAFASRV